jgi:NAD(P)-dependent dehydrogenase (short-subunit alcohol dehydrogenase family)
MPLLPSPRLRRRILKGRVRTIRGSRHIVFGYRRPTGSKTALNAVTRILADELTGTGVLVNSADVGWVRTDMGGPNARSSVEQGADTPVWLATLGDDGPTGGFFRERRETPW